MREHRGIRNESTVHAGEPMPRPVRRHALLPQHQPGTASTPHQLQLSKKEGATTDSARSPLPGGVRTAHLLECSNVLRLFVHRLVFVWWSRLVRVGQVRCAGRVAWK